MVQSLIRDNIVQKQLFCHQKSLAIGQWPHENFSTTDHKSIPGGRRSRRHETGTGEWCFQFQIVQSSSNWNPPLHDNFDDILHRVFTYNACPLSPRVSSKFGLPGLRRAWSWSWKSCKVGDQRLIVIDTEHIWLIVICENNILNWVQLQTMHGTITMSEALCVLQRYNKPACSPFEIWFE